MFKRKLQALKHHNSENFSVKDEAQYRSAVAWLEDQHIRHYKVEERENLRSIKSADWPKYFIQYLNDLECPIDQSDTSGVLDWLLGWAIHLEYGENKQIYQEKTAENMSKNVSSSPRIVATNPLDNLSFDSDDFKTGVNNLAKLLNVTKHPNHLITVTAISQLIKAKLSSEVLKNPTDYIVSGKPFPLNECDLGFETGDYVLNQAAKIMRLLFIRDQRDLQTKINEIIVAVQAITANPKTDSSLGKVGI